MLPKSLYNAFRKHHVRQYYLSQLEVLRTSAKARTFHRLEALAQQDDNRAAAVKACQVILTEEPKPFANTSGPTVPGFVIVMPPGWQLDAPQPPPQPLQRVRATSAIDDSAPTLDSRSDPIFRAPR